MQKSAQLAQVEILLTGYFHWLGLNKCQASSTVTLIKDSDLNIIVDTGTRSNQTKLIKALAKYKLKPAAIDYVIITHPHTDHLENLGLFPKAKSLNVFEIKQGDQFQLSAKLLLTGQKKLTKNVILLATPGHTPECLTVVVKTGNGLVALAGDLFVTKQEEKGLFINNRAKWQQSRKKILAKADYIIPGHGPMFKIKK